MYFILTFDYLCILWGREEKTLNLKKNRKKNIKNKSDIEGKKVQPEDFPASHPT